MTKAVVVVKSLNWILLLILALGVAGFLSFQNAYGFFLASVTAFIALGIYKHFALAYFSAAAWGLACYQLAKEGYEFQQLKREVMTLGVMVIPLAIFLHEKLARNKNNSAQKSVKNDPNNDQMPQ